MTSAAFKLIPIERPGPRSRPERWAPRANGLLRDPRVIALSDGAARVYAALVDGSEQSYLRGLLDFLRAVSVGAALAAVVPQSAEQVDAHLDELRSVDLIAIDRARRLVYVPALQQHICAAPQSVQALTATLAQLADLPACPVVERVKADLLDVTARAEEVRTRRRTGDVAETLYSRLQRALDKPLRDVPTEEETGQLTLRFGPQLEIVPMSENTNRGGREELPRATGQALSPAPVLDALDAALQRGVDAAKAAAARRGLGAQAGNTAAGTTSSAGGAPGQRGNGVDLRCGDRRPGPDGAVASRLLAPAANVPAGDAGISAGVPASIFGAWRYLVARCPELDAGYQTESGLTDEEAKALSGLWRYRLRQHFALSDFVTLGDWLKASDLGWCADLRSYVLGGLQKRLSAARTWDRMGRKPIGRTDKHAVYQGFAPKVWTGGKR